MGSSLAISTKASNPPATIDFLINGIDTFITVVENLLLKVRLAQLKFGDTRVSPDIVAPYPTAKYLTRYANIRTVRVPLI